MGESDNTPVIVAFIFVALLVVGFMVGRAESPPRGTKGRIATSRMVADSSTNVIGGQLQYQCGMDAYTYDPAADIVIEKRSNGSTRHAKIDVAAYLAGTA